MNVYLVSALVSACVSLALLVWALAERRRAAQAETRERELAGNVRATEVALATLQERANGIDASAKAVAETFGGVAQKAVNDAADQLLKRAEEAFVARDKLVQANMEKTLNPVRLSLKEFERKVTDLEAKRQEEAGGLKQQITDLLLAQTATREETQKLSNALRRGAGIQGRWGEQMLRNVLEMAGLRAGIDFEEQVHAADDDGAGRPDVVVRLPGSAYFVIDSKVSLTDYEASLSAGDEAGQALHLKAHADSMRRHIGQLSSKGYWAKFDRPPHSRSPDVVVMFVPLESAFACAVERNPGLVADAWDKRVAIVTPSAMFPLLKAVAYAWRAEDQAANARHVADLGRDLYKRLSVMGGHVAKVGERLGQAVGSYNQFVGSLESQVMSQARRFEDLKVDHVGKEIEPLEPVDAAVRPLAKLAVENPTLTLGDR